MPPEVLTTTFTFHTAANDNETRHLDVLIQLLEMLEPDVRARVLKYLIDRFDNTDLRV